MHEIKKLYRKENKKVFNYKGNKGGDFCHSRNTKAMNGFEGTHMSMHGSKERGMDYTPLFKFLLSKVGQKWDDVYSEAISRLDKKEPIFWMVDLQPNENDKGVVRLGESSYYSKLTVNKEGVLIKVNPDLTTDTMFTSCNCCTHTFNGVMYKTGITIQEFY